MIEIVEARGGYRINVHLEGMVQRTAWMHDQKSALRIAKEFAEYYGSYDNPLPIHKPWE